jgi:predicted molibdopterin-dependent oxidoreductase YjgC
MFVRLPDIGGGTITITVDGTEVKARAGDSVAAALAAAGRVSYRTTPVSGSRRGPYCAMGACFECLVTIDGTPNQQACVVRVSPGMQVSTQRGARAL